MKREILFRAKRTDNGEWVKGDLIHGVSTRTGKMYILPTVSNLAYLEGCDPLDGYSVIPDSVGLFIGLTDKNGTKIFEGDIIKVNHNSEYLNPLYCEWDSDNSCFTFVDKKDFGQKYYLSAKDLSKDEVLSNIFDNKELIK